MPVTGTYPKVPVPVSVPVAIIFLVPVPVPISAPKVPVPVPISEPAIRGMHKLTFKNARRTQKPHLPHFYVFDLKDTVSNGLEGSKDSFDLSDSFYLKESQWKTFDVLKRVI